MSHSDRAIALGHLAPFRLICPAKDGEIVIRVAFTNHCYTQRFDPARHQKQSILLYEARDRARIFCPERYELSRALPAIVRDLPGKRVHQSSQRRNFVFVTAITREDREYCVFFALQRENRDGAQLKLTVESAYLDRAQALLRKLPGRIRFEVLAYKTLRGEPIRFAPR